MPFTDMQRTGMSGGFGGIAAGLGGLFGGGSNPADAAMPYLKQIPGEMHNIFDPYLGAGYGALPQLNQQYGQLMNDPGGKMNQIGGGFQQSPGFKFALQQALGGAGHAAAAGGMAGSPQHEQQNMEMATQLGNQDYYNWMKGATGLYGKGLEGIGDMAHMGLQAGTSMSDQIAQALAAQAQTKYAGEANENQRKGAGWGDLIGGAAQLAAFL